MATAQDLFNQAKSLSDYILANQVTDKNRAGLLSGKYGTSKTYGLAATAQKLANFLPSDEGYQSLAGQVFGGDRTVEQAVAGRFKQGDFGAENIAAAEKAYSDAIARPLSFSLRPGPRGTTPMEFVRALVDRDLVYGEYQKLLQGSSNEKSKQVNLERQQQQLLAQQRRPIDSSAAGRGPQAEFAFLTSDDDKLNIGKGGPTVLTGSNTKGEVKKEKKNVTSRSASTARSKTVVQARGINI